MQSAAILLTEFFVLCFCMFRGVRLDLDLGLWITVLSFDHEEMSRVQRLLRDVALHPKDERLEMETER